MFPKQKLLRKISSNSKYPTNICYSRNIGDFLTPTERKLFEAVAKGKETVFENLLKTKDNEIDWNKKDPAGHTLLQVAVFHSRKKMILPLIRKGCDHESAYSLACELGDHELTLFLLKCINQPDASDIETTDDETDGDVVSDSLRLSSPSYQENSFQIQNETGKHDSRQMTRMSSSIDQGPGEVQQVSFTAGSVGVDFKSPNQKAKNTLFEIDEQEDMKDDQEITRSKSSRKRFRNKKLSSARRKRRSGENKRCTDADNDSDDDIKGSLTSCLRDPKPLILAAAAEDFDSTQNLINCGCSIPEPHSTNCNCRLCDEQRSGDPLQQANDRLQIYKALTSATYLILKENDPILTAIQRSETLHDLAYLYPENKTEFEEMAESTSKVAVDLLASCRSAEEVEEMLTQDIGLNNDINFKYGRLLLAVGLKHKKFVTHASCQYVLTKLWFANLLPLWMYWPIWRKLLHILIHMLLMPFVCTAYAIAPKHCFLNTLAIPFNRFIYSASSYMIFLFLLLFCITYDESTDIHETLLRWYDWCIAFWVLALLYKTIHDIYIERFVSFWTSWWTGYEFVMVMIFIGACICFLAGRSQFVITTSTITSMRLILVGSGLYSLGVTLAFIRVLQWFHLSRNFGHLIISFSRMTEVLFKLLIVFSIVLFAFSIGLHSIYKDFHPMEGNNKTDERTSFMNYGTTIKTLFWALFGEGEADYAAVPNSYLWQISKPGVNISTETFITADDNTFSVVVGYILWSLFHVAFVIILLNMLIAVMTNSFDTIQENCDTEWKFARSKIWMYYFEDYNAVPPPFNFLFVISSIFKKGFRCVYKICILRHCKGRKDEDAIDSTVTEEQNHFHMKMESLQNKKTRYTEILKGLIQRYLHDKKLKSRLNATVK